MVSTNPPSGGDVIGRGIVRDLQWQVEGSTHMNVCRFRIERKNAQGKQLPAVPVEMRSMSFSGTLSNGDWVELSQKWTPGALLHPHEVVNLTTKVPFKSTLGVANTFKAYPRLMKVMAVIAGLIFLAVVAGFVVFAISAHNSF